MIKEKGGVNSDVFIEFLKRLLVGAKRPVFLIVDRGPAHISKKTKAFVATLGSRLKLFYLPAYCAARLAAIPAGESPANRGVQSLL
jgi:transposase